MVAAQILLELFSCLLPALGLEIKY